MKNFSQKLAIIGGVLVVALLIIGSILYIPIL